MDATTMEATEATSIPRAPPEEENCCSICGKAFRTEQSRTQLTNAVKVHFSNLSVLRKDGVKARLDASGTNSVIHTTCRMRYRHSARQQVDLNDEQDTTDTTQQQHTSDQDNSAESFRRDVLNLVEENTKSQLSFESIEEMAKNLPGFDRNLLDKTLREEYTEVISERPGLSYVVTKRAEVHNILLNNFQKSESEESIVRESAAIIRKSIKDYVKTEGREFYPSPEDIHTQHKGLPGIFKTFLETLFAVSEGDKPKKTAALAHLAMSIVKGVAPMFVPAIHLYLGVLVLRKFASKVFLDLQEAYGLTTSYYHAQSFADSILRSVPTRLGPEAYLQYAYDNVDLEHQTLHGKIQEHSLAGIMIVAPACELKREFKIKRSSGEDNLTETQQMSSLTAAPKLELKEYKKVSGDGLAKMFFQKINKIDKRETVDQQQFNLENWQWAKNTHRENYMSWGGSMSVLHSQANNNNRVDAIVLRPVIRNRATDLSTIYTALLDVVDQASKMPRQTVFFVTLDQPLFVKAVDVVAAMGLTQIVPRLGSFHVLMNFLKCIYRVMKGSGIEEIFLAVNRQSSNQNIVNGTYYESSLRCHMLLAHVLMSQLSSNLLGEDAKEDMVELRKVLIKAKQSGPTAKLWIQYLDMIDLVKQVLYGERLGKLELQLDALAQMVPFFHATGQYLYAKSVHLAVQTMRKTIATLPAEERRKFQDLGFFAVRRVAKGWAGTATDQCIEQDCIKILKDNLGGLPRRGETDTVYERFVASAHVVAEATKELYSFSSVSVSVYEQHKDTEDCRKTTDSQDFRKISTVIKKWAPFHHRSYLINIASGKRASTRVNCHKAKEIGQSSYDLILKKNYATSTLFKNKTIINMSEDLVEKSPRKSPPAKKRKRSPTKRLSQ